MRIGLHVTNFTWPNNQGSLGEMFALLAQRAEQAGCRLTDKLPKRGVMRHDSSSQGEIGDFMALTQSW
jgi:hypothetical protein